MRHCEDVNINRLPKEVKRILGIIYSSSEKVSGKYIEFNKVYHGDARNILPQILPNSIALSIWSPPYFLCKKYEAH